MKKTLFSLSLILTSFFGFSQSLNLTLTSNTFTTGNLSTTAYDDTLYLNPGQSINLNTASSGNFDVFKVNYMQGQTSEFIWQNSTSWEQSSLPYSYTFQPGFADFVLFITYQSGTLLQTMYKILVINAENIDTYNIGLIGTSIFPYSATIDHDLVTSDSITYTTNLNLIPGNLKFRQDDSWFSYWGGNSFPTGTGVVSGSEIYVNQAGNYDVTFNRSTGAYNFTRIGDLPSQILNTMSTNGLMAWYPFNGNGNDMSGNGYHLTNNNCQPTTNRFGNNAGAYIVGPTQTFSYGFCNTPNSFPMNVSQDFSFSFWVNMEAVGQIINLKYFADNVPSCSNNELALTTSGNSSFDVLVDNHCSANTSSFSSCVSNFGVVLNEWQHIAYTKSGNTFKIYIDGVLRNTQSLTPTNNIHNAVCMQLGSFSGKFDDLSIYSRSLTDAEITNMFNSTATSSIAEIDNFMQLYPNPTSHFLNVKTNYIGEFQILDLSGRMLITTTETQIDLSSLSAGQYFIKAGENCQKIILE